MKFFILVQLRSLIPNQFNFEGQNHEKYQFKKLAKKKKIVMKRMRIKILEKKHYG